MEHYYREHGLVSRKFKFTNKK